MHTVLVTCLHSSLSPSLRRIVVVVETVIWANRHGVHGVHGGHGGRGGHGVHGVHHVGRNIRGDYFLTKILWPWCQGLVEWQDTNLVPLTGIGPQAGA